jgi:uncharacterized repeat protein (TIGR01451 family)
LSKEIAQTVGGKRILWLVAILAAFAALASVLYNQRSAKADVVATDFTLTGGFAGPTADFGSTSPLYTATIGVAGLDTATLANLQVVITMNASLGNIGTVTPSAINGSPGNCAVSGVTSNVLTCTWPGPIPAGATGTVTFTAKVVGVAPVAIDAQGVITAQDLGSAQGTVTGATTTAALTINQSNVTLAKAQAGTGAAGTNVTYTITVTNPTIAGAIAATNIVVTDSLPTQFSAIQSLSVTGAPAPACSGVGPTFPDTSGPFNLSCTITGLALDATATITVVGTVGATATGTFTNTVSATAATEPSIAPVTTAALNAGNSGTVDTILAPGLYHVSADGEALLVNRDVPNNAIGWNHTVCLVDSVVTVNPDGTTVVTTGDLHDIMQPDSSDSGIQPPNTTLVRWRIDTISGTSNVQGQAKIDLDFTQYENGLDLPCVTWYSTGPGEQNVTIVDVAGQVAADWANDIVDQTDGDITNVGGNDVCYDNGDNNGASELDAGLLCIDPITSHTPLVKEWNQIETTYITRAPVANIIVAPAAGSVSNTLATFTNFDGGSVSVPVTFNPVTSSYAAASGPLFFDHVIGSHQSAGGNTGPMVLIGAIQTYTVSGTCGAVEVDPDGNTTLEGGGFDDLDAGGTTVTTIGVAVAFRVVTGTGCSSLNNSNTIVTITTTYANNLGSINPLIKVETVRVNWTATLAQKQVFLAWAGQRIVLEHDWRIPPGDVDGGTGDPDPDSLADVQDGICPWEEDNDFFAAKFVKGSGPGNFLPGSTFIGVVEFLEVFLYGSDEAIVFTDVDTEQDFDDIDANSACITRVGYESEDPGEVDIELFAQSGLIDLDSPRQTVFDNQSKVAFVVYYMKFNTVKLGIVGSVSKPTHNGSIAGTNSDYAPGNPWDATKDVTTIDWNVSRDLLIRGRVSGWFINTNPSGRAADTTDPNNILPADRWVMPNDWALLAGGPKDPDDGTDATGTAEQFRPYYDLMIAPNNARGLALLSPTGVGAVEAALTIANAANTASGFVVTETQNLVPGVSRVFIGSSTVVYTITSRSSTSGPGFVTISPALAAAPAANTPLFLITGVPFEGPYSLIDVADLSPAGPELAGAGQGSAALSNIDTNNVRDTIWQDGDVDMWDAPMPPSLVSVKIRGTGVLKQVIKSDVYYLGTPNTAAQVYPNPFYVSNIPDSPFIPAVQAGGGYDWDSWGLDGPGGAGQQHYTFWQPVYMDRNSAGIGEALTAAERLELAAIRTFIGDPTVTRDIVIYSDNHGEFMVTANGDFKTDLSACATNVLGGGKHCKPGDKVGVGTITATADYPDFRGKHFPVVSNAVTANWTWGGYKDVTIEEGEDPQFRYVVFHGVDRDGFCLPITGATSLHPVLSGLATDTWLGASPYPINNASAPYPAETIDFLIDSGEGIILNSALNGAINRDGNRQFATGVRTFSTVVNDPATTGIKEFPLSALAAAGATDECQAWIRVSNSLLGILNVLVIAHDDEGDIAFDRIVDLQNTATYTLNFRWSLVTWSGADNIPVMDALKGTGANEAGNDISGDVTAVYGWEAASQEWLGFFPDGVNVPGANDLVTLKDGSAYWIAIKGPGSTTWTIATNVGR